MGIPRFAAWLTKKYPAIVSSDAPESVHGLYLDMNGIIHPCCHSEDSAAVAARSDDEKIRRVCEVVAGMVARLKPSSVLFLAMDGVAPRAKMNQQRARRYMSAAAAATAAAAAAAATQAAAPLPTMEDAPGDIGMFGMECRVPSAGSAGAAADATVEGDDDDDAEMAALRAELDCGIYGGGGLSIGAAEVAPVPLAVSADASDAAVGKPGKRGHGSSGTTNAKTAVAAAAARFDSNCISPGTEFMVKCADGLRAFVQERLRTDPLWASLLVVVSDTNTPGEGEHKIIDFLRSQATHPSFVSKGSRAAHVVSGLDADLVLLCLSLHMPNVVIFRDNETRDEATAAGPETAKGDEAHNDEDNDADAKPTADGSESEDGEAAAEEPNGGILSDAIHRPARGPAGRVRGADDDDDEGGNDKDAAGGGGEGAGGTAAAARKGSGKAKRWRKQKNEYYNVDSAAWHIASEFAQLAERIGIPLRGLASPGRTAQLVDDFIAMASLMGNDFMPRLPSAFCGDGAMDNLIEVYVRCVAPFGGLTVPPPLPPLPPLVRPTLSLGGAGKAPVVEAAAVAEAVAPAAPPAIAPLLPPPTLLNWANVTRLLEGYSRIETLLFRQQCLKSGLIDRPEATAGPVGAAIDECWRARYFASTGCPSARLNDACAAYLQGLHFVWAYYSSDRTQWHWFFPFHHAPFATDLAAFLRRTGFGPATREDGNTSELAVLGGVPPALAGSAEMAALPPPLPFLQLLAILPPTSAQLLPAPLRPLLRQPPPALQDAFCTRWTVDGVGSNGKEHLATVVLPFVDWPTLVAHAAPILEGSGALSEAERARHTNHTRHQLFVAPTHRFLVRPEGFLFGPCDPQPAAVVASPEGGGAGGVAAAPAPVELAFTIPPVRRRPPRMYDTDAWLAFSTVVPKHGRGRRTAKRSAAANATGGSNSSAKAGRNDTKPVEDVTELADFVVATAPLAALGGFFTLVVSAQWSAVPALWSLLTGAAPVAVFVALSASFLLMAIGYGCTRMPEGVNIARVVTPECFFDWQCPMCLSLTWRKNERCFNCSFPFSEDKCSAVYTGQRPQDPPALQPDHRPYITECSIPADNVE